MNALRLYLHYIGISVKSQMQYRASFVMMTLGSIISTATDFVALVAFFSRFGSLGEWSFYQVCLMHGMTNIAFAICEGWMRGFDVFQNMVKSGDFDRLLLRPRSTVLQVMGSQFQVMRIGRLTVGISTLCWGVAGMGIQLNALDWLLIATSVLGGAALYGAIILVQATSCFWTVESLEVFNTITYGGVETTQYPVGIYEGWVRNLFTRVIPMAAVNYWPASYLLRLNYVPAALSWLSPLVGPVFFVLGILIWRFGVRHYRSTGS